MANGRSTKAMTPPTRHCFPANILSRCRPASMRGHGVNRPRFLSDPESLVAELVEHLVRHARMLRHRAATLVLAPAQLPAPADRVGRSRGPPDDGARD